MFKENRLAFMARDLAAAKKSIASALATAKAKTAAAVKAATPKVKTVAPGSRDKTPEQVADKKRLMAAFDAGDKTALDTYNERYAIGGKYYGKNVVNIAKPTEPTELEKTLKQTYDEQAKDVLSGEQLANAEFAKQYDIGDLPYNTMEGLIDYQNQGQQAQRDYLAQSQAYAKQSEAIAKKTTDIQTKAQEEAIKAQMAQGREGVMSAGAPMVVKGVQGAISRYKQQLSIERQSAALNRQKAEQDLERAIENDDIQLASALRGQIKSISNQLRQLDIDEMDALRQERDSTVKAVDSFTEQLKLGITFTPQAIAAVADSIGVDKNTLQGIYSGMEQIRQDKTLDVQTKEVEMNQKMAELQDYVRGVKTEKAKTYEYYNRLSPSQKAEFDRLETLGNNKLVEMPDGSYAAYNPVTNEFKQVAAADEITNYDPEVFKIGQEVGWCGDYASTLSTAPTVGNNWSDKREVIEDKNITRGDKLLIPSGVDKNGKGYGHVAVVLNFNPITGDIQVAESNKDGRQNKGQGLGVATFGTYNVNELNVKFGSGDKDWGVAHGELRPEYAAAEIKDVTTGDYTPSQIAQFNEYFTSGGKTIPKGVGSNFQQQANDFKNKTTSPDLDLSKVLEYSTGRKEMTDTQNTSIQKNILTADQISELSGMFDNLDENDFGPIMSIISSNNPYNEKAQAIKAKIQSIIPNLARGVYGEVGVLTDNDIKNYAQTIPNLQSTEELRNLVLDMTKKTIGRGLDRKLRTMAATYDVSGLNFIVDEYGLSGGGQQQEDPDPLKLLPESNLPNDPLGLYPKKQ